VKSVHRRPVSGRSINVTGFLEYPLWLILLVSLAVVLGCGEIGRRIGVRVGRAKEGADSTLESALLGLLALMIGFTFAMGMSRACRAPTRAARRC
jgi:hypothetical protein